MNRSAADRLALLHRFVPLAAGILLAVFLLGMRWGYVGHFGSDLPVWDQWDAEGLHLLAPWKENRPIWPEIFQAHNEHRIVLTKLLNLAVTLANNCWDQRLEGVVNALLPATIAAFLFLHSRRFCPPLMLPLIWLLLAIGWGSPLGWENMVSGFHSQQLFLIGLSYGAIACLPGARPWSRTWWLGTACAVLALGSMASGFFAALVVLGLVGWQLLRRQLDWRHARPTLGVVLTVVAVGVLTRVSVDYHEILKAHSIRDFSLTFWYAAQWPVAGGLWLAALAWAPWGWLVIGVLRHPRGTVCHEGLVLLGLGGWVLLQLLATAYVRGNGGLPPPPRYIDTLVFGVFVNALALGWLATRGTPASQSRRVALAALGAVWLAFIGWGGAQHLRQGRSEMAAAAIGDRNAATNTRHFLLTDNTRLLESNVIPYPDFNSFIPRVTRPSLRALMPASVRPPLAITTANGVGFTREKCLEPPADLLPAGTDPLLFEPVWSSWNNEGARNTGEWTSAPIWTKSDWIEIRLTGSGNPAEVALEIRDARIGHVLAVVSPPARPGVWQKTYVHIPSHGFVLAGFDRSPTGWLAFGAPVEVHALSYFALMATEWGWPLARYAAGGALLLAMCAGLAGVFQQRLSFAKDPA